MKTKQLKYIIAFLVFVSLQLSTGVCNAQSDSTETVYDFADEMPKSKVDYVEYIAENLIYPKEAVDNNIQGTVYATIIVNKDGNISNVQIIRDIGYGCGKEVKRVLMAMPAWKPAKQNGRFVAARMTIPVKFVLQNPSRKSKSKE